MNESWQMKTSGVTPKKQQPLQENEQLSDIFLILDKMELLLQVVSTLDKNGNIEFY